MGIVRVQGRFAGPGLARPRRLACLVSYSIARRKARRRAAAVAILPGSVCSSLFAFCSYGLLSVSVLLLASGQAIFCFFQGARWAWWKVLRGRKSPKGSLAKYTSLTWGPL